MPVPLITEFDVERAQTLAKRMNDIETSVLGRIVEARNLIQADMSTVDELKPQFSAEGQAEMGSKPDAGHALCDLLDYLVKQAQGDTADYAAWKVALDACRPAPIA